MNIYNLWSLRLGYSNKQSANIQKFGLDGFLEKSFDYSYSKTIPVFLENAPKNLKEVRDLKRDIDKKDVSSKREKVKNELPINFEMKAWWLENIYQSEFPLREKMVGFWHNHFVSTFQKVKVNYWIYQHNQLLREHAFGNFKVLTKKILKSNAMIMYLDNKDNKKSKINENLSREFLELFTIGIGNYTENDIKEGAKALAGLHFGDDEGQYRSIWEDNSEKIYFKKRGNWKADDLVDIIFEQPQTSYLIVEKFLKWFLYDEIDKSLVTYYGDYFRKMNYEIKPLLTKIFTDEFQKNIVGQKIKDPLTFIFQLAHELNLKDINFKLVAFFLKSQEMDLFNQPNVKGWTGGKNWLTTQLFLQRNNTSDLLVSGKMNAQPRKYLKDKKEDKMETNEKVTMENVPKLLQFETRIDFKKGTNKEIIKELSERLLFSVDDDLQKNMETVLKYDFDSEDKNAQAAIKRLLAYICKTPEFQLI